MIIVGKAGDVYYSNQALDPLKATFKTVMVLF